jgi:integrase
MLRFDHLNLQRGWVDFPRPKTGIDRRCPLWPETVQALKAAIKIRPEPKLPVKRKNARKAKPEQNIEDYIDRVFITKYGQSWEPKSDYDNPISKETTKLLKDLEVHRKGVGFYALRHTFQTIGGQSRDRDAVRYIMGHVEDANDMSARYTEETVSDDRLKAVTDYVRDWFRSAKPKGKRKSA